MSRLSTSNSAASSRPSSSMDKHSYASADVAADLRTVVDLRRKNDEMTRELVEVRLQLDAEKQRVREANRDRASALKSVREQLDREREHLVDATTQRVRRDCKERFEREREKDKVRDDDSLLRELKRKDEEIRAQRAEMVRERDDYVRKAVQECEERVRESAEQQAAQQRAKLMAEMWGLREQKLRVEQMLEARIDAEHERAGDLRRQEENHEREIEELVKKSRSESVRDVQKIRLAERIVQSKEDDISYYQQLSQRLTADNEKLTDEVTRLRIAEVMDRRVAKAMELSPKWRRKSEMAAATSSRGSTSSLNQSPTADALTPRTPRSLSPSVDRRDKPASAMGCKIIRLEATVKNLEEKISTLKQENVALTQTQTPTGKTPGRVFSSRPSSSESEVASAAAADRDENATIRRLRKNNSELSTTLAQLKGKVKLLEGDRDRAVRQESHGTKLSRHESIHRPASRSSSRDKENVSEKRVVLGQQKEKLKALDGLQQENIQLVQHITRLTSDKMVMERNADLQLRNALQDVEATLSLRNAEIELLSGRLRRLDDKCRTLESRQPTITPGSGSNTGTVGPASSDPSPDRVQHLHQQQQHVLAWTAEEQVDARPALLDRSGLGLRDFPPSPPSPAVVAAATQCVHRLSDSSSGASTPQHPASSPFMVRGRLSNPSTPIQVRAVSISSPSDASFLGERTSADSPIAPASFVPRTPTSSSSSHNNTINMTATPSGRRHHHHHRSNGLDSAISDYTTATGELIDNGDADTRRLASQSQPNAADAVALDDRASTGADSSSGAPLPEAQRHNSLDNVISSLDNFKLSQDNGDGRLVRQRPRSPHSFSEATSTTTTTTTPPQPHTSSGIIADATFTPPGNTSPASQQQQHEQQQHNVAVDISSPRPTSLTPSHGSGTTAAGSKESPFSRTRSSSPRPLQPQAVVHLRNGFGGESPDFDSDNVPTMSQPISFPVSPCGSTASSNSGALRVISDLDESGESTPAASADSSPVMYGQSSRTGDGDAGSSNGVRCDDAVQSSSSRTAEWLNGSGSLV